MKKSLLLIKYVKFVVLSSVEEVVSFKKKKKRIYTRSPLSPAVLSILTQSVY